MCVAVTAAAATVGTAGNTQPTGGPACSTMGVCFGQVARMKGRGASCKALGRCKQKGCWCDPPRERDPRFVTVRRDGTLTDSDHHLLALWAASCAEHVLESFESARPQDPRPRQAIEQARAWAGGEITMTQARTAGGDAMAAVRDLSGARRHAAYAAGQAAVSHTSPRTSSVRPPT